MELTLAKSLKGRSKRGTKTTKSTTPKQNKITPISSRAKAKEPADNTAPRKDELVKSAWAKLGVAEVDILPLPKITPILKRAFPDGIHEAIALLRASAEEEAVKFIKQYDELAPSVSDRLPIEAFCKACSLDPRRLLELITTACYDYSTNAANLIGAIRHPMVVEAATDYALTPDGHQDRKMLLQRTGFVPAPKNQAIFLGAGSTLNSNSNNQVNNGIVANQTEYHPNDIAHIDTKMSKIADRYNKRMGIEEKPEQESEQEQESEPAEPIEVDAGELDGLID